MLTLSRLIAACLVLGLVSLAAVLAAHLALTDIWHGEGDLRAEWTVLQVASLLIVAFQLVALFTFWRLRRIVRHGDGSESDGGPLPRDSMRQ